MVAAVIAFTFGVWLLQQQAALPPLGGAFLAAALIGAGYYWRLHARGVASLAAGLLLLAGCAGAGFHWAAGVATWRLMDTLSERLEGEDIRVRGVVAELPERTARGWRFAFDVEQGPVAEGHVPRRVLLSWLDPRDAPADAAPSASPVVPGERWQFVVRLKRPHGTANPHGFDAEAWLLERGVRATGYVRAQPPPVRLDARVARPGYLVQRLRMDLRDRLEANLGAVPYAGVLVALAIGDQQSIPTEQWSVFTRTGVNHLMSISGLHVTMLSGLAFVVTASVWRRMPRLLAFGPARDAAATVGLAVAVGYALIAGFAVPAQRTVWMLAAVAVCLWLRFTPRAVEILAVALLVVSLVDPMAVTAPGFWLSFAAVAVMMYAAMEGDARFHWLGVWTRVQWALFVGLLPLLLVLFGQASLVAPLANAIAVPVVSFAVVPLALLATVLPWPALAAVAHGLMALLAQGLVALSSLPLAVWTQHAPPVWAVSLALLGAGWLLAPRGVPNRGLGIVLMAPLVLLPPLAVPEGQAHIAVLDVGQGSAAVIRTRTGAYVFDTGPVWSPETDSGARIVVPYLRGEGIRQLDGLFVSHDDNDHSGGVRSILAAVPAAWVASSLRDDHPLLAGARRRLPCVAGTGWTRDGVRFDVLHPPVDGYTRPPRKDNAVSCVLRVSVGTTAVLLTADIEKENEVQLLATHAPLAAEVLIVPHHGSRTSSTAAFVAAVHPRVAVFTVGYRNRFDHPRPDVVARYEAVGAALLRSDRDGAVLLDVTARGVAVRTWRAERRRYWQTAFAGGRS